MTSVLHDAGFRMRLPPKILEIGLLQFFQKCVVGAGERRVGRSHCRLRSPFLQRRWLSQSAPVREGGTSSRAADLLQQFAARYPALPDIYLVHPHNYKRLWHRGNTDEADCTACIELSNSMVRAEAPPANRIHLDLSL